MLINTNVPVSLNIEKITDLRKLRVFMEDNNIKINKSEIARRLGIDHRTINKYLHSFEKSKNRNKPSKASKYYEVIKDLLSSETQVFTFRRVLHHFLTDNYGMDLPEQTFYHYLKTVPEFDKYFQKSKISTFSHSPVIRYETALRDRKSVV